jgi:hypothetical protein
MAAIRAFVAAQHAAAAAPIVERAADNDRGVEQLLPRLDHTSEVRKPQIAAPLSSAPDKAAPRCPRRR